MKAGWRSGFFALRIVGVFGLLIGVYYGIVTTETYETRVFQPYLRVTADLSGKLLGLLGYQVVVEGDSLESPEFAFTILKGCDGLEPMALFVSAILVFSAPALQKLAALAIGIPFLVAVNLVRIVSLFLVGTHYPDFFHTIHVEVWQVLYVVVTIVCFAVWLAWVTRSGPRSEKDVLPRNA